MAQVVAVFNQAGGVGKTSLVHHLGYLLASYKRFDLEKLKRSKKIGDFYRVLVIDMNLQAFLTIFMGLEPLSWRKQSITRFFTMKFCLFITAFMLKRSK